MLYFELGIVAVLIVVNGLLAMSELAIVSSRPARLKGMIERGENGKGAARALELAANPGRFLSSVQIGITLVGVLSGAFSGATLGQRLSETLLSMGVSANLSDALGVGIVVAFITYASLIVGELVPKQIALRDPEAIATRVAPTMGVIATIAAPLVWLLDISGRAVLWLLGQSGESEDRVTDEEIKMLVAETHRPGDARMWANSSPDGPAGVIGSPSTACRTPLWTNGNSPVLAPATHGKPSPTPGPSAPSSAPRWKMSSPTCPRVAATSGTTPGSATSRRPAA